MTTTLKVLIVDAVPDVRAALADMLADAPGFEVIGATQGLADTRAALEAATPDAVVLGLDMPGDARMALLHSILSLRPKPVVLAVSLVPRFADVSLRALELGAFEVVARPETEQESETRTLMRDMLLSTLRASTLARVKPQLSLESFGPRPIHFKARREGKPVIAFGASTGGIAALMEIFAELPALCPPVVVAQHMPAAFTRWFAARLNAISEVTVLEAVEGARLQNGYAYLAPGDHHLSIVPEGKHLVCHLTPAPTTEGVRPSIDVLLQSVAVAAGRDAIGVLLTGMGHDGVEGLRAMRLAGAYTLAEDVTTANVADMPRTAIETGAAIRQVPLPEIASHLVKRLKRHP